jgi:hypothetical protein
LSVSKLSGSRSVSMGGTNQLSNANAITLVSVAARLLAKAAAFLDQPAGKNARHNPG